jgi:hypothetical protein
MQAVASWIYNWNDAVRDWRRRYRRALAHRLAKARLEERRLKEQLPKA